ncbi:MAG: group II intron reverse transcriptase domain-containing protein [Clostridia bacterium]|nr:group II intron reverse transcriptase domain-containing protein [Clostridia bacterium]
MESIINKIENEEIWEEYLEFKKQQLSMTKYEIEELEEYIHSKQYMDIAKKIVQGKYEFSIPQKHLINKINKSRKRVVYTFNRDENLILKVISYLFSKKYDKKYSNNCYSFRKKYTAKNAIKKLTSTPNINELYGYKVDIENYFNSVNVDILLKKLKKFIEDDNKLFEFIKSILKDDRVMFNNEIIHENKGIMAGVPISSFLANIYIQQIDEYFEKERVLYARYSDDIIFFTNKNNLENYIQKLNEMLELYKLNLNNDKIKYINPAEKWDFLGFSYHKGRIDLSNIAKKKIKGKIKRASKKLRRWMLKKDASYERGIRAVIKKFNKKFYEVKSKGDLTWSLWYFPIINTSEGLHEIDIYMQECLRYIKTGRHNKKNYNLKYEELKKLGYKPLVSEYYKFIERREN